MALTVTHLRCRIVNFLRCVFNTGDIIAKVIPLFKSGSKNDFNTNIPISLLPQLSKILEKLHSNRLNIYTKTCDILHPCQYGFREKLSTTLAHVKVVSEITNIMEYPVFAQSVLHIPHLNNT